MGRVLLAGVVAAALAASAPAAQAQITLIEDGRALVRVVTPAAPSFFERRAAGELADYLGRIGGAAVEVTAEPEAPGGVRILVGKTQAGRLIVPDAGRQGPEGFVIRTRGRDVAVVGGGEYGTLYGAYELLEKYLGVRWYLPDPLGEIVPQRQVVTLPEIDDAQKPAFAMRWVGRVDGWNLRNKQNRVTSPDYPPAFRVEPSIYHGQYSLVPPKTYFDEHPEYFALIGGERSSNRNAKLCYSNPEVARVVAENLAALKREDPAIALLSFSPTDGQEWCGCDACQAMDDPGDLPPDQQYSRRSLVFYNRIAEELEKLYPDQRLLIGAYNVYNQPPKDPTVKAHPNLAVIITHYDDYCSAHPVNDPDCPPNRAYRELIQAWQRLIPDVYFYEYYHKANWVDLPWPIVHAIAADIPYFRDIGIKGLYTQYTTNNMWTNILNYYVAAKLLWDPDADVAAMLEEFYRDFYGAAAEPMKAYWEALEEAAANAGHFPGNAFRNAKYVFTEELLERLGGHLERARALATDEASRARIEKAAVSHEYTTRLSEYLRRADPERLNQMRGHEAIQEEAIRLKEMAEALLADLESRPEHYEGVVGRQLTGHYRGTLLSMVEEYARPARHEAQALGLVREWMVIGPFDNAYTAGHGRAYPPEAEINLAASYEGKEGPVRWRAHRNPEWDGYIDLAQIMEPNEWTCAYALCYVTAEAPTAAQLRAGSNDSLVVWLGGERVLDRKVLRPARMDDDVVEVTLPAGTTPVLLKVCQSLRDWGFYFRVTDREGNPLPGVKIAASPDGG